MFGSRSGHTRRVIGPALLGAAAALVIFTSGRIGQSDLMRASQSAVRKPSGAPQLVSIEPLPSADGEMCQWIPASASSTLTEALLQEEDSGPARSASKGAAAAGNADRKPARVIRDTFPTYSAIAVNLQKDEVLVQDENLFGIKVFDRLDNTPAKAAFTEPKRAIAGGETTKLQFNCGLYVDPVTGDIYSVTNDTINELTVFPWNASGEILPKRSLRTPHGTYGISVDEAAAEMYLTVQHENSVVVYPKEARDRDKPIRTLEGDQTRLEDPHGVAVDVKNNLMFVSNHGNGVIKAQKAGRFDPPSITVYPLKASGDTAPLRVIQGPKTRLNWPASMWVDSDHGELYVANDSDDSIVVFKTTDDGDVAPVRTIRGPNSHVKNPTGVFLDSKHDELWVSNMGNHSATVYQRTANGDAPPVRIIRSAPLGKLAMAIGNPGAVAYDNKRDEILAPN
jgi:DNA-binding beta-propeller fold protein YncE